MAGQRHDPYRGFNFLVEIHGITRAGFREASGLDSTQDPVEYREGNEKHLTVRKLTGLTKFSNLSLKWGICDDKDLWEWRLKAADGKVERQSISVVLLDDAGDEKARWNLYEAWPTKWTGPSFNATSNDVAVESLDIAYERMEWA